jgi:hypothetical protein
MTSGMPTFKPKACGLGYDTGATTALAYQLSSPEADHRKFSRCHQIHQQASVFSVCMETSLAAAARLRNSFFRNLLRFRTFPAMRPVSTCIVRELL